MGQLRVWPFPLHLLLSICLSLLTDLGMALDLTFECFRLSRLLLCVMNSLIITKPNQTEREREHVFTVNNSLFGPAFGFVLDGVGQAE